MENFTDDFPAILFKMYKASLFARKKWAESEAYFFVLVKPVVVRVSGRSIPLQNATLKQKVNYCNSCF